MKNKIILNIQIASKVLTSFPPKHQYLKWIQSSLKNTKNDNIKILIRLVEKSEIKFLNNKFRKKNNVTNILSFSYINDKIIKSNYIGDLIVCGEVIEREAIKKKISTESHWAHIIIHGILHLLGYTHSNITNREKMESLETKIMQSLNYKNPYSNIKKLIY